MKRFTIPLAIALALSWAAPVLAVPIVRSMSQAEAQGQTATGAIITVWEQHGTNLDFTQTGERIQRAWLDDPSRITLDFDTPLEVGTGASIIHLRRVLGITLANLPRTSSTLLTVVTQSTQGLRTYLFEVRYGSGEPDYASVAITPNASTSASVQGVLISGHRQATWFDVEQGLQQAINDGTLSRNSPVVLRTQDFLARVRNGQPIATALEASGVSMVVVTHLAELGYPQQPSPPQASYGTPPLDTDSGTDTGTYPNFTPGSFLQLNTQFRLSPLTTPP